MVDKRRGRPLGRSDAHERLLTAARRHFDEGDLLTLSTRRLAEEVGVSHSLVNYHFGSRDGLVAAAAALSVAPHLVVRSAIDAGGSLDTRRLFVALLTVWDDPDQSARLGSFARELAGGGASAAAVAGYLEHGVFDILTAAAGRERARRLAIVIVGTIFTRYVLRLPSTVSVPRGRLVSEMVAMTG